MNLRLAQIPAVDLSHQQNLRMPDAIIAKCSRSPQHAIGIERGRDVSQPSSHDAERRMRRHITGPKHDISSLAQLRPKICVGFDELVPELRLRMICPQLIK